MKVKISISYGWVGAHEEDIIEVTESDLEGTTLDEFCEDYIQTMIANRVSAGWEVIEP
jgi:hypothetical protein